MESGVWRSGVGEWECGEAQGMSSGMSPELDTESGTGRDSHSQRCDETGFQKMFNVTHCLLVIGKDVMRLAFTKCAMLLTCCWP